MNSGTEAAWCHWFQLAVIETASYLSVPVHISVQVLQARVGH